MQIMERDASHSFHDFQPRFHDFQNCYMKVAVSLPRRIEFSWVHRHCWKAQ